MLARPLGTRFTAMRKWSTSSGLLQMLYERRSSSPFTVNFRVTYWPWTKRNSSRPDCGMAKPTTMLSAVSGWIFFCSVQTGVGRL